MSGQSGQVDLERQMETRRMGRNRPNVPNWVSGLIMRGQGAETFRKQERKGGARGYLSGEKQKSGRVDDSIKALISCP